MPRYFVKVVLVTLGLPVATAAGVVELPAAWCFAGGVLLGGALARKAAKLNSSARMHP